MSDWQEVGPSNTDGWEPVTAAHGHDGWSEVGPSTPQRDGIGRSALGLGEALLNMGSQIPAGMAGGLTYLGTLAGTGGDLNAAMAVKQGTEEDINKYLEYQPRTQSGKDFQQMAGEGMQDAIVHGGRTANHMTSMLGLPESDAVDTFGRVLTEGAMNVLPFEAAIPGIHGKYGVHEQARAAAALEALKNQPPVEPTVKPTAIGPANDRGIPGTPDQPQGSLFGEKDPGPTTPIWTENQSEMFGDPNAQHHGQDIQFEHSLELMPETQARIAGQDTGGLQMPMAPDRLSLDQPRPYSPIDPAQFDRAREGAAQNPQMQAAMQKAQMDQAFRQRDAQEQTTRNATTDAAYDLQTAHEAGDLDFHGGQVDPQIKSLVEMGYSHADATELVRQQTSTDGTSNNGSGESSASLEAQSRLAAENAGGQRRVRLDTRTGEVTPLVTADRVDTRANPHEVILQRGIGKNEWTILDQGENVKNATGPIERARTMGKLDDLPVDNHSTDHRALTVEGDRSLMAPEKNARMTESIRAGDIQGALGRIADSHPSAEYRSLAEYLAPKMEGVTTRFHDSATLDVGERAYTGYFDSGTSTLGFSREGATSPHTVLHESVHALTSQFLKTKPQAMQSIGLRGIYNQIKARSGFDKFPGIINEREFLAEAFSNENFQSFLKKQIISPEGSARTAWSKFVSNVKSMLGIKDTAMVNALSHTIDIGKRIVEESTPNFRSQAAEQLRASGVPSKLVDLMATEKKPDAPIETSENENAIKTIGKIPGLTHAVSDFAFYDKPIEEIVKMAQEGTDIPTNAVEKLGQQLQAGGLFESLKTRNPVVKYTYERITRAYQEAAHNVKQYLTDPHEGLKSYMRDMTPEEKGGIHSAMMLVEGQREMSHIELAQAGFNEKQIAYYGRYRELSAKFFNDLNQRRTEMGLKPMDARVGHMAGRFMGDFSHMVYENVTHPTTGNVSRKVVGRISGSTKWKGGDLSKARDFISKEHPEYEFGPMEYNGIGKGKSASDRFSGLMETLNLLGKEDAGTAKLLESYQNYIKADAVNFLNATRHAKAKVEKSGGVMGSEGNKPWADTIRNAQEGMKGQLSYFEQGYTWMAMEKAIGDISKVVGDGGVVKQMPEAVKWANQYTDHSLGRKQGWLSDGLNGMLNAVGETTGLGHSNIMKANNNMKHVSMQLFMGLGNLRFSMVQLMQPFQVHPPLLALLRTRGLELSMAESQVKAVSTMINGVMNAHNLAKLEPFDRSAVQYAQEKGIFDVKMSDHTKDINQSRVKGFYDAAADLNITIPEMATRGTSFFFYAHILRDAGIPAKDVFGAAENMTNMTMVNYHPAERPMAYGKAGWLGDVASTLTRYKHNQLSQAAFYTREGVRGARDGTGLDKITASAPLMTFLATSLAFSGVMGIYGFTQADQLYSAFMEHVLKKPDNLANLVLKSGMPEVVSHGMFAALGVDMTGGFSNADILPQTIGRGLVPYGSAILDQVTSSAKLAMDPLDRVRQKQALRAFTPQALRGPMENYMMSEKRPDGTKLYKNYTDGPNLGKGRVVRDEHQQMLRNFGTRTVTESKELDLNYSEDRIKTAQSNIRDSILDDAKRKAMEGALTPAVIQKLARQYAEHGSDSFAGDLTKWSIDNKLDQKTQRLLHDAMGGYKGAFDMRQRFGAGR